MPEQYRPKRGLLPTMLSQVSDGTLIKASCGGCSRPRWYHPKDLLTLLGDMPTMNLDRVMRCEQCRDTLRIEVTTPLPEERVKLTLRRIDRIWWAKRVRWRDENL